MANPTFDTEIYETESVRGNINCGGVLLNLDKLTFSISCVYCEIEMQWKTIKEFAHHFQEHLVMSETENQLLIKNIEENNVLIQVAATVQVNAHIDEKSDTIENENIEQTGKQSDYEIEMLDDATEENTELSSNNDNLEDQYVYHVVDDDDIVETQLNKQTQEKTKIEPQQFDDDGTTDLGFDLLPNDAATTPTTIKKDNYNKNDVFACDICGFQFVEAATLRKHRAQHNHCHLCKVNFPSRAQLKHHLQTHIKQKVFVCEDCEQCFKSLHELTEHRKRHITAPLHLCNTCGKSFQEEKTLRQHIKTHTTARPFVCMECNMTFSRQKALMLHASMHSDIRKFSCAICRMTFAQNSGLITHMKEKHRNTIENDEG